jgi:hypothetical protein
MHTFWRNHVSKLKKKKEKGGGRYPCFRRLWKILDFKATLMKVLVMRCMEP